MITTGCDIIEGKKPKFPGYRIVDNGNNHKQKNQVAVLIRNENITALEPIAQRHDKLQRCTHTVRHRPIRRSST